MAKQEHGTETAGSPHLDPPAKGRERSGDTHHWGWHQCFEASNLSPSDTLSPTMSHFQILPNQFHQAGTKHSNIYTSEDLSHSNHHSPFISNIHQENAPHPGAQANLVGVFFFQVPSSQMPLVPGKLTRQHSGTGHSSENYASFTFCSERPPSLSA